MDFKTIKGTNHYLYDSLQEFEVFNKGLYVVETWRKAQEGEWAFTDDNHICQILKKGFIAGKPFVRTVCGTYFVNSKKRNMLGEDGIAECIYSFAGTYDAQRQYAKNKMNGKEFMFAQYVASGMEVVEAFKKAYPSAKSDSYIKTKSQQILKKEKVQQMVKEEIKKILEDEGVTPEWLIGRYKDIATLAERDGDKLRSLESLAKISGLFDTEKKQEQLTVWAGFTPEQMEAVKDGEKTKLIAHAEKEG
tara:strand:- start:79 stop:822 length:744 start_codon:yes stop_codon:yes gene_type:complete